MQVVFECIMNVLDFFAALQVFRCTSRILESQIWIDSEWSGFWDPFPKMWSLGVTLNMKEWIKSISVLVCCDDSRKKIVDMDM